MSFKMPVKLNDNVYWVGCDKNKLLNQNVYLYIDEDIGAIIDPAFTQLECMYDKISQIIDFNKIKYIIIQNYEPDTVKALESLIKVMPHIQIVTHWKISVFLSKFEHEIPIYEIDENNWKLKLKNKELEFIFTPFNYFAGSFVTYDKVNKTLFSSELFSATKSKFQLYVDKEKVYLISLKTFHQLYLPNEYMKKALKNIPDEINFVLPKYGSILEDKFIKKAKDTLLQIDAPIDFEKSLDEILSKLYKDLVLSHSLDEALKDIYTKLEKILPTFASLNVVVNNESHYFGMSKAKDFVEESYNNGNIKIEVTVGTSTTLKEEEKHFLEILIKKIVNALVMAYEKYYSNAKLESSIIDSLTKLYTLDFLPYLEPKFREAQRYNQPLSLAYISVDIDDNIGKLYKDCIIREIANILRNNFRASDIIIRDKEANFLLILPITKEEDAMKKIINKANLLKNHIYCGSKAINVKDVLINVIQFDPSKDINENIKILKAVLKGYKDGFKLYNSANS